MSSVTRGIAISFLIFFFSSVCTYVRVRLRIYACTLTANPAQWISQDNYYDLLSSIFNQRASAYERFQLTGTLLSPKITEHLRARRSTHTIAFIPRARGTRIPARRARTLEGESHLATGITGVDDGDADDGGVVVGAAAVAVPVSIALVVVPVLV